MNMKRTESADAPSLQFDNHGTPENSKSLSENLEEANQCAKRMMKLIEENEDSVVKKDNMDFEVKPELTILVEDFYRMYETLAEHYHQLRGEVCKSVVSGHQMGGSEPVTPFITPDQKLGTHKPGHQGVGSDLVFSSGGGSSDISLRESLSSSSSDSESETYYSSIKNYQSPPLKIEFPNMKEKLQVSKEENADWNYEDLVEKITKYEEELRVVNLKVQSSEEEVARLKCELEKNESLIGNLQVMLESASGNIETRTAELELEKKQVLELQKLITELETQVFDSNNKIETTVEELEVNKEKFSASEEENAKLKLELSELNIALCDAQNKFSVENTQLQFDISILSEEKASLEGSIAESELRSEALSVMIKKLEAEKIEMKDFHESREIELQGEIKLLKEQHAERGEHVEALNKKLDRVMTQKDELNVKLETIMAEMRNQEIKMRQLEERFNQASFECLEAHNQFGWKEKQVGELTLRVVKLEAVVEDLEAEVEQQRVLVLEGAEGKREAIRQLCFSLEHYRSGYQELRQAVFGHKRPAILA